MSTARELINRVAEGEDPTEVVLQGKGIPSPRDVESAMASLEFHDNGVATIKGQPGSVYDRRYLSDVSVYWYPDRLLVYGPNRRVSQLANLLGKRATSAGSVSSFGRRVPVWDLQ